jgi:ATP adenylyltransferase
VNVERIWAPWRLGYVTGADAAEAAPLPEPLDWPNGADRSCFLCRDAATYDRHADVDRRLLVVDRSPLTITVLNLYPYNNGHLLVAPRRHAGELTDLSSHEHLECQEQLARLTHIYRQLLKPDGFNVGLNLGRAAGAGLPGHLHWHLVPRWSGDTNFMSTMAGARVIPQSLESLWELLTDTLKRSPS